MNTKTFLSSHFPDFVKKWKRYYHKFKQVDSWYITSDYCLDDKTKNNDVMTFTIFPLIPPYVLKEDIKHYLPQDIKKFKNISETALNYIKESPYFFSMAFLIKDKNSIFKLEDNKQLLDNAIKRMELWPEKKREEFIHQMKSFRNYLNRKEIDVKILSDIGVTVHIMSAIIEFLLIKTNTKHILWVSDRDKITDFQDGIVHQFIRFGYSNLLKKRVPDHEVYDFIESKQYDKELFDELIRIPDYICGSLASMDFDDTDKVPEKHYNLFDRSIVDNDRICIMHIEHGKPADFLSEVKFTRSQKKVP